MTHLRHLRQWLTTALVLLTVYSSVRAQTQEELAQLDPGDIYYQAWLYVRQATAFEKEENFTEAFNHLQQARLLFNTLAVNHPDFRSELVADRQKSTNEALTNIHQKALNEQDKKPSKTSGFVEGPDFSPNVQVIPRKIDSSIPNTDNMVRLREQIRVLKQQLATAINDRDANAARLRQSLRDLEAERQREASSLVQGKIDRYKAQIQQLSRENRAMKFSLRETKAKLAQTQKQLNASQTARAQSEAKVKELEALLSEQSKVHTRVAKGQQDQIDELRRDIKEKNKAYGQALKQIKSLKTQLQQSQEMVAELQEERDELIRERDHMTSLLKLNSGDRIQELINQNVSLSRDLSNAQKRVQILEDSETSAKEDLVEARNDLVITKHKIQSLQKEARSREGHMAALKKRLSETEADLLDSLENPNASERQQRENQLLLDIIEKQQAHMEMQEKTGRLLVEQAERMAKKNELMEQALNQYKGTFTPALTAAEEKIVEAAQNAFSATSLVTTPSEAQRLKAQNRLDSFKTELNRVATRLFDKQDYQAARGNLEMIVEEDPGAWDAMMNLGIVNMRLDDPTSAARHLSQAILLGGERKIPHAHLLLGHAYKKMGQLQDAEIELKTALDLKPENAQARVLLGNIAGSLGRYKEAETQFNEAIKIDATIYEPHLNLAYLHTKTGHLKKARTHYHDALKLGAPPHLRLQQALAE